jgi:hypothetical protein
LRRVLLTFLIVLFCAQPRNGFPETISAGPIGQWVWSPRDKILYEDGRRSVPDLRAAVWVGTIFWKDGHFSRRLALPPFSSVSGAIVIRLDNSVHGAWRSASLKTNEELDKNIRDLLSHVKGAGGSAQTVQLDYDCPVARLAEWSSALKILKEGSLRGSDIWITSLISHVDTPSFGQLFGSIVSGHILQVFDTGDAFTDARPTEIRNRLEAQGIPFQMGFGTFERGTRSGVLVTQHQDWLRHLKLFAASPLYRGSWIFPAGRPWTAYLKEVL